MPIITTDRLAHTDADVAIAAADAGARVVREMFGREDLTRINKSATDFATEADLTAEHTIQDVLAAQRPGDGFLGEETGLSGGTAHGRLWMVDPLCGTLNFAARTPLFCVNVALSDDGGVAVAASCDPIAGELYWTDGLTARVRRDGADTPLAPSARSRLVDVNCDSRDEVVGPRLLADPAFRSAFGPRVTSTSLALAWVAAGRRAGYVTAGHLDNNVHFSAGIALCEAAGCVVTDLEGNPVRDGYGLIAAADVQTHRTLLDLVRARNRTSGTDDQRGVG